MTEPPALLWLRADLRLDDHDALAALVAAGAPIVPVFVWDPDADGEWAPGAASRVWLHHSLASLGASLAARGSRLVLASGATVDVLGRIAQAVGAQSLAYTRRYEPAQRRLEAEVARALGARLATRAYGGALLFEPEAIAGAAGQPMRVFTPFWRRCLARPMPRPVSVPKGPLRAPARWPQSLPLDALGLLPSVRWDRGITDAFTPGEAGAARALAHFVDHRLADYASLRDRPAEPATSRLSPHLHFGEITPRRVVAAVAARADGEGAAKFLAELGWREFAHHLLWHFPHTATQPLRGELASLPATASAAELSAWQRGSTGYPLVDAGLRELWATGSMHNRVRMVAASLLVKHLQASWRDGARWFWDTLVDADLASNTLGWQWTAGCGADAAPYERIFNPVLQGERFDPQGAYVRRWIPALARLPDAHVHAPWEAPALVLAAAGVRLGRDYPPPIVDHAFARKRALAAYSSWRGR